MKALPPIREIGRRVAAGEESAESNVRAALRRAREAVELGAFVRLAPEEALARARDLDRRREAGEALGPLAGVPFAVKANIAVAGWALDAGSAILEGHVAPVSATAVDRLLDAGAVPIGATNQDEFGMGSSCEWSRFGPTRNPWAPDRVPGGSSGGSAAAVAARVVPFALGSDTGGSVRQPAAFCGVVGLRPSQGRVSRSGLVAFASSMDQIGPLAARVDDAAVVFDVMAEPDPLDATSVGPPGDPPPGPDDLRLGRVGAAFDDSEAARAVERALEAWGGDVVAAPPLEGLAAAVPCYLVLSSCEASSNLARYDGIRFGPAGIGDDFVRAVVDARSRGFGPEVRRRVLLGTFALSAGYRDRYHARAQAVRRRIRRELEEALVGVDALVLPTAPTGAFRLGERLGDPLAMYRADLFTTPASLAGLPAVSVPVGLDSDGLPLGLQLIGRRNEEARLLAIAAAVEGRVGFDAVPALSEET